MQVKSLDHIHIYAADPESSARFYMEHFDAKPIVRNTNVNADTRIFLALGGQVLVLGSFPSGLTPSPPPEPGDGAYRHGFGVAHFGLPRRERGERAGGTLGFHIWLIKSAGSPG